MKPHQFLWRLVRTATRGVKLIDLSRGFSKPAGGLMEDDGVFVRDRR